MIIGIIFIRLSCTLSLYCLCRLVAQKLVWFAFLVKLTLPRESGVVWNWMSPWGKTMGQWQEPGKQTREDYHTGLRNMPLPGNQFA
jgi:hypothetical protein